MSVPFERRSGFKWDSICHVDLHLVRPSQLSFRSMNFGQHWRTEGVRDYEYSVAFPVAGVSGELLPLDILFFLLAIGSAFKVGSGATSDE